MVESKYANRLRALGFTPQTEEDSAYMERRVTRRFEEMKESLNRNQRRKMEKIVEKILSTPVFIAFPDPDRTHARDEKGQWWTAWGNVNLAPLKFTDLDDFVILGSKLPPLKPTNLH